jgi:hypothetical protein
MPDFVSEIDVEEILPELSLKYNKYYQRYFCLPLDT